MRGNNWKGYQRHFKKPKKGYRYRKKKVVNLKSFSIPIGAASVLPKAGRGIRCLSLFDGIASGLVSLDKLGIQVDAYFSSEICEAALEVQRFNFHNRIVMLGSVTKVTVPMLECLGPIDLLIGGSPCSELSLVNPRAKGFEDPASSANLFFEFARICDWLRDAAVKQKRTFHYLFENTTAMKTSHREIISDRLGVQPITRNARDHTGMKRNRYFWSNIPEATTLETQRVNTKLQDHLKPYRTANFEILPTITSNSSSQRQGSKGQLPASLPDGTQSLLLLPEQESLFGLRHHFTDAGNLSLTTRRKLLGKSWCIPVIVELLRPLLKLYQENR